MELDLSHCTSSLYDRNGFLGIAADCYAEGSHGMSAFHQLSPGGMDHRPVDPIGEIGELCWSTFDAHEGFVFPLNDVRTEAALPNLEKGATRLFDTGTFKGHPFHFTIVCDPINEVLESKSWRPGGKIRHTNVEGAAYEMAVTEVSFSGLSVMKCGGDVPLALATLVNDQLNALKRAVKTAATGEGAAGTFGMKALLTALSEWPLNVDATITKGA